MASGPSVTRARTFLDELLGSNVDVRLWTVAPGFDGTGGTEVVGGSYTPAVLLSNPSAAGTGGQIAKATNSVGFLFNDMPVASTGVVAISVHNHTTGEMEWLNDSWSSPVAWSVGESPFIGAGKFAVAFVPVS